MSSTSYGPSSTPSQLASSAWRLVSCSWPLITVDTSVALPSAGGAATYERFVVFTGPSGAPAGENTCTNTRTVAPGARPPWPVRSTSGASAASNTPFPFESQNTPAVHPAWLLAVDTAVKLPLPSTSLPALTSRCEYTTVPPGATCAELLGTSVRLRTTFTLTASCRRSVALVTGDWARK